MRQYHLTNATCPKNCYSYSYDTWSQGIFLINQFDKKDNKSITILHINLNF